MLRNEAGTEQKCLTENLSILERSGWNMHRLARKAKYISRLVNLHRHVLVRILIHKNVCPTLVQGENHFDYSKWEVLNGEG